MSMKPACFHCCRPFGWLEPRERDICNRCGHAYCKRHGFKLFEYDSEWVCCKNAMPRDKLGCCSCGDRCQVAPLHRCYRCKRFTCVPKLVAAIGKTVYCTHCAGKTQRGRLDAPDGSYELLRLERPLTREQSSAHDRSTSSRLPAHVRSTSEPRAPIDVSKAIGKLASLADTILMNRVDEPGPMTAETRDYIRSTRLARRLQNIDIDASKRPADETLSSKRQRVGET